MTGVSVLEVPRTRDSRRACVPLPSARLGLWGSAWGWGLAIPSPPLCPAPLCLPGIGHPLEHEGPLLFSLCLCCFLPQVRPHLGETKARVPGSALWFPGSVGAVPGGPGHLTSQPGQAASPTWRYREPY